MKKVKHITLSHSSLGQYHACPRLWAWERLGGLVPVEQIDESTTAAFKGTLIHEAIDTAWTKGDWRKRIDELLPANAFLRLIPENKSGSLKHIMTLIESYLEYYNVPNESDYELVSSEQQLELRLTNRISIGGRVDKIFKRKSDGKLVVVDHKTSSSPANWVIPLVQSNAQFTGYVAMAQSLKMDCSEILIDCISTAKKDIKNPFTRVTAVRTPSDIAEWKSHVVHAGNRLIEDIENGSFTNGGQKACLSFGGCTFLDVCNSPQTQRAQMLKNGFKRLTDTWEIDKIEYK